MREYFRSKLDYAIQQLMNDPIEILKELYTEEWAIYQDFLNLNPMAATFAWSDLYNQAQQDIEEGHVGDIYKTSALFKIQFHTTQHKIYREEWVKQEEIHVQKWTERQISNWERAPRSNRGEKPSSKWQDHFDYPHVIERRFNHWYGAQVADLYRHHFPPCDFATEQQVVLEFGFVETKDVKYRRDEFIPHGVNIDSVYDLGVDRVSPGKYPRDEWLR